MLRTLADASEIEDAQKRMLDLLERHVTEHIDVKVSFRPELWDREVSYSNEQDIWWHSEERPGSRLWNIFGIGRPKEGAAVRIACEINFPLTGIDRRIGGAILKDTSGELVMAHRGKIGGGRSGIGKSLFVDYFRGEWVTAEDGDIETDFALIGALKSPRLFHQVGNFIREVERIKQFVSQDAKSDENGRVLPGFREEFSGTRRYRGAGSIVATSDHGIVVNQLASHLRKMGYHVGNDRNRDLYVLGRRRRVLAVFEVKTDASTTSIYTAIGQLLLNNVDMSGHPKLILLLPEQLNCEEIRKIETLGISACRYDWTEHQLVFTGVDKLI